MARPADLTWFFSVERKDTSGGETILTLAGRLGRAAAAQLEAAIHDAEATPKPHILLDLSGLDYISSPGLAVLERAASRLAAEGGGLRITEPKGPLKVSMDLAGPIPLVTVVESC